MTQECVPEEEELKLRQGPDRGDEWGRVSPHLDLYFHTPPVGPYSQVPD